MKIKKNFNNNNFYRLIFEEIYLLLFILIIAFSVTIYLSIKETNKIKETYSKATIILPPTEVFSIAQIAQDNFYLKDSSLFLKAGPESLRERFNINFNSNLISFNNLQKFLNLETSSNYIQSLKQKNINIKNYFEPNNLEITNSSIDHKRKFLFVLSLKHPLDLDGEDFLKSYIEFTKNNILNDYVNLRVDAVNRVILLLKNNLEITQKLDSMDKYAEDNRIKFFQLFLDQIYNTENEIGDKDILFNYLANLDQKSVTKKIEILEFIKKDISYFDYEPILEINTEQYLEKISYIEMLF